DDAPDLDLRSLLHVEHHADRPGADRLRARRDPGVRVAFRAVSRLDLARVQLQGSGVEQLPLREGELFLERLLLDLLRPAEDDLLHQGPLVRLDRVRDAARTARAAPGHAGEGPGREAAAEARPTLTRARRPA